MTLNDFFLPKGTVVSAREYYRDCPLWEGQQPPVLCDGVELKYPSTEQYIVGLKTLIEELTDRQAAMLRAHYASIIITSRELSSVGGFNHPLASNLHYGNVGKKLRRIMGVGFDELPGQQTTILASFRQGWRNSSIECEWMMIKPVWDALSYLMPQEFI